jgi:hypothetical protein
LESAVLPRASATRTTTVAALFGAVYCPVSALIDPEPVAIENRYGATPPVALKACEAPAFTVTLAGLIANGDVGG